MDKKLFYQDILKIYLSTPGSSHSEHKLRTLVKDSSKWHDVIKELTTSTPDRPALLIKSVDWESGEVSYDLNHEALHLLAS